MNTDNPKQILSVCIQRKNVCEYIETFLTVETSRLWIPLSLNCVSTKNVTHLKCDFGIVNYQDIWQHMIAVLVLSKA